MLLRLDTDKKIASRIQGEQLKAFNLDERDLQGVLFDSLDQLLPDDELLVIMQSRRFREDPDLLAIDEKGSLYVFELKVWESKSENLLQVLRYGQLFGSYAYADLDRLYKKARKVERPLLEAHRAKFGTGIAEKDFNNQQVFVVVTNGLDVKTREAIQYWRRTGLEVRPWIYRVYRDTGNLALLELNAFRVSDNPYEDVTQGFYIVNTNIANDPLDDRYMIENHRAAAYSEPWKRKIERLKKGDVVMLYRSGVGIVAVGRASGEVDKRAYSRDPEDPEGEYSMVLHHFREVSPPLSAAEIKEVTGRNMIFQQTLFGIDAASGEKLLRHITHRGRITEP